MIYSVAEEIEMFLGLKTEVVGNVIIVDTIAGQIKISMMCETVMENVYRFIYIYGSKLHKYGLRKRIEEGRINNKSN